MDQFIRRVRWDWLIANPVLQQEVRRWVRHWRTRIGGLLLWGVLLSGLAMWSRNHPPVGKTFPPLGSSDLPFLNLLALGLLLFAAFAPLPQAASALTREREQHTWESLLTSHLTVRAIVLSKWFVALWLPLSVILVSGLVGGWFRWSMGDREGWGEWSGIGLGMVATTAVSSALGLYFSARCRRTLTAVTAAYGALGGLLVGTVGGDILLTWLEELLLGVPLFWLDGAVPLVSYLSPLLLVPLPQLGILSSVWPEPPPHRWLWGWSVPSWALVAGLLLLLTGVVLGRTIRCTASAEASRSWFRRLRREMLVVGWGAIALGGGLLLAGEEVILRVAFSNTPTLTKLDEWLAQETSRKTLLRFDRGFGDRLIERLEWWVPRHPLAVQVPSPPLTAWLAECLHAGQAEAVYRGLTSRFPAVQIIAGCAFAPRYGEFAGHQEEFRARQVPRLQEIFQGPKKLGAAVALFALGVAREETAPVLVANLRQAPGPLTELLFDARAPEVVEPLLRLVERNSRTREFSPEEEGTLLLLLGQSGGPEILPRLQELRSQRASTGRDTRAFDLALAGLRTYFGLMETK